MIYEGKVDLLKEGLREQIFAAKHHIEYRKLDSNLWNDIANGGILGYPATIILFSIIDAMGSVFSGNQDFKINVGGKETVIKKTNHHIYILNSKYFGLNLEWEDLKSLYDNVRSPITHNCILPQGYTLQVGTGTDHPFYIGINENGKRIYFINLIALYKVTHTDLEEFLQDIDNGIIKYEDSKPNRVISMRDNPTAMYNLGEGKYTIKIKKWIVGPKQKL